MKVLILALSLIMTGCAGYVQPGIGYSYGAPVYRAPLYLPGYGYGYGNNFGYQPGLQFNFGGGHNGWHHHDGWR